MIDMLDGWMTCPPGELDRLEHRLKLRHLWALCVKSAAVAALSGIIGVCTWSVISAFSPARDTQSYSPPAVVPCPIEHSIHPVPTE